MSLSYKLKTILKNFKKKVIRTSAIAVVVFSSCATPIHDALPDQDTPNFGNADSPLYLAVQSTEIIADLYNRVFLYAELAQRFIDVRNTGAARSLLLRGLGIARTVTSTVVKQELLVYLARYFFVIEDFDNGLSLVRESFDLSLTLGSENEKGTALSLLVELGFTYSNYFGQLLRDAIDFIYVLEDPLLKVQLLTDISKKYQDLDARNRVRNLLQQSIAAVPSIRNPWSKAEAYTRIAQRLKGEGDQEEAQRYVDLAVGELNSVSVLSITLSDAQVLQRTLSNLSDMGQFKEVLSEINRLPREEDRLAVQLILVERYLTLGPGGVFQARLATQRIFNQLDAMPFEISAHTLVRLAEIYSGTTFREEALRYARSADAYISQNGVGVVDSFQERLAGLYAKMGEFQAALSQISRIGDGYLSSMALNDLIKESLGQRAKGIDTKTDEAFLLQEAVNRAETAEYLKETALVNLASTSLDLGLDSKALEIVKEVRNPYLLAQFLISADKTWKGGFPLADEELLAWAQLRQRITSRSL